MAKALLEEVAINPTIEPPELIHDWGKHTLGAYKQNLVCNRTQENGAVILQEIDPDLPVSAQESPEVLWVCGGLRQGRGYSLWQCVHRNF